mmetsp:Transcript_22335/g.61254  ORF Transcript_22335/g.61254 Transcript_22335/m.61254 type:complete len:91 (-) Transcript_22335:92-364(-)
MPGRCGQVVRSCPSRAAWCKDDVAPRRLFPPCEEMEGSMSTLLLYHHGFLATAQNAQIQSKCICDVSAAAITASTAPPKRHIHSAFVASS